MRKPILTIFYQFNPWRSSIGGIQTIIRSFIKYSPDEFEVRLVGTGKPDSSIGIWQEAEFAGRPLKFMPVLGLTSDDVRTLIPTTIKYTAALAGRNLASDFMHFHRIEPTWMTRRWSGEKTLFIHNDIQQQMVGKDGKNAILWKRIPAVYFAIENQLIRQFTHTYVCNTESVKFYQQRYPAIADRFSYLKNTVDSAIFSPLTNLEQKAKRQELARQLNLSEQTRFILFAGRLHPQKDPILLVRAFALIKQPDVHLLIAGGGELAEALKTEIERLELSAKVTLLGAVEQQRLADLHRASSAFVLSSAYEGLPVAVLEALASGSPVITTPCGETPKFLTADSGIVCLDRKPETIAQALKRVLAYPENYPSEACTRVAQPYTASSVVNSVYQQMWQRWQQRQ